MVQVQGVVARSADGAPATGRIYLIGRNASNEVACDAPVGCRVDEGVDFSLEATVQ